MFLQKKNKRFEYNKTTNQRKLVNNNICTNIKIIIINNKKISLKNIKDNKKHKVNNGIIRKIITK